MEENLSKSIRNGLYAWLIFALISFSWGIYDFIIEEVKFNFVNLLWTIFGAILATVMFFVLGFAISLIVYYFKEKKK